MLAVCQYKRGRYIVSFQKQKKKNLGIFAVGLQWKLCWRSLPLSQFIQYESYMFLFLSVSLSNKSPWYVFGTVQALGKFLLR